MDVRGERILIFGDSLSHHGQDSAPEIWDVDQPSARSSSQPGDLLASMLAEQGAQAVRVNARVGRSAHNFFGRENVASLIASDQAFKPTKVVVVLGTNDIGLNLTIDGQDMARIRDGYQGMGAEVWAIGPVTYVSDQLNQQAIPVVSMMQDVFGSRFIDGRPLSATVGRARDGVHFGPDSARLTATAMAQALASAKTSRWKLVATGVGAITIAGLIWSYWRKRPMAAPVAGLSQTLVVDGKKWRGSEAELVRSGARKIPCKSGIKSIACWKSLGDLGNQDGYRVAYTLVTRRDGKVVSVRKIIETSRPMTLAEAEKLRRKWGRGENAWVETMDGKHVPVQGAKRPAKFVDDARDSDVHATLTADYAKPIKGLDGMTPMQLKQRYQELLQDPDPASMRVAEDFLLENGLKLSDVSSELELQRTGARRGGVFRLKPGANHLLDDVIWWAMDPPTAGRCRVHFTVAVAGKRVGGSASDLPARQGVVPASEQYPRTGAGTSRWFEAHYSGGEDYCRRAAAADAWAIAKQIKELPAVGAKTRGRVMTPEMRLEYAEKAIKLALDQDNSEPSELYGAQRRPEMETKTSEDAPGMNPPSQGTLQIGRKADSYKDLSWARVITEAKKEKQKTPESSNNLRLDMHVKHAPNGRSQQAHVSWDPFDAKGATVFAQKLVDDGGAMYAEVVGFAERPHGSGPGRAPKGHWTIASFQDENADS